MTEYTKLSTSEIASLLEAYCIGRLVASTLLSGGSENTNYKLTTSKGEYVLTLCEQKSVTEAQQLADLLAHLEINRFNTSKVIANRNGEHVTRWQNKPVMIKSHLPGSIVKDLSSAALTSLGQQLAKLHLISAPNYLARTVTFGKESFDDIKAYDNGSDFHLWLNTIRDNVYHHANTDLPRALIHSDVFFDNVIISPDGQTTTIMDFEEACYYYRVFDIGMMLVGLCEQDNRLQMSKAQLILQSYLQILPLQDNEKQALQTFTAYAAAATAFWRHKQYYFVMPDSTLQTHYLTMKHLGDDILSIEQTCFNRMLETA